MTDKAPLNPVLKWAGSKRWLIPTLATYFNDSVRLVDPFGGAGTVPLGLRPTECLMSDVNPHLMNFHRWVQHGLEWTEDCGIEFVYDREVYYQNRSKFNALCEAREFWTKEGALLFYYLNRTGFNGLCRFNRSGLFNVPFGSYKTVKLLKSFGQHQEAMKNWDLYCGDFENLPLRSDDFVYADPPYDVEFTQFAPRDFVWDDQIRLAKWLAKHTGLVVASNQYTTRIVELYRDLGFEVLTRQAPRSISCNGDRTPAMEIIAIKRPNE